MVQSVAYDRLNNFLGETKNVQLMSRTPAAWKPFVEFALIEAFNRREDAGYSGAFNDGGASLLEQQLLSWVDGLNKTAPTAHDIKSVYQKFNRERDPEYKKYLELQKKFGN